MKRLRSVNRAVKSGQGIGTDFMFTAEEVVQFLSIIEELRDYSVSLEESLDGALQITVGDSVYEIVNGIPSTHT